jgi:hypothetical protein
LSDERSAVGEEMLPFRGAVVVAVVFVVFGELEAAGNVIDVVDVDGDVADVDADVADVDDGVDDVDDGVDDVDDGVDDVDDGVDDVDDVDAARAELA